MATVKQISVGKNLSQVRLVSDSQEIEEILSELGIDEEFWGDITACVKVMTEDGYDVEDVYLTEESKWWLDDTHFDIPDFWFD